MKAKIITVLFFLVLSISSFAATIQYDGPWMWNDINVKTTTEFGTGDVPTAYVTSKGTIAIAGYKNEVTSLEIPKKLEWVAEEWGENFLEYGDRVLLSRVVYDLDVVAIAENAFNGNRYSRYQKLETVSIPNTVTKIGSWAFFCCSNLKSVVIPNSVTEMGTEYSGECFSGCSSLASVTLPNQISAIPYGCFRDCTSLVEITIPASVEEICVYAFYRTAISAVNLSSALRTLKDCAFQYCPNLKKVTVENVSRITQDQFYGSTNIEELVLGDGVRDVGNRAFNCDDWPYEGLLHLRSLTLGNNITNIGADAFYRAGRAPNTPYMSVVIPPSVKSIRNRAFECMYNVTNLVVQGVQKVNSDQFGKMTNLVSLTFGAGVEEIEDGFYSSDLYNLLWEQ